MNNENSFIGQHIGGYRIVTEIGRGTFGSVFTGEHIVFKDRPIVAIKILHANFAFGEELDKFLKEAESLEKLKHPHILRVIEAGIQNNIPYIITEYAPNGDLRKKMIQRVSLSKAMSIIKQIGTALSHAHSHNLVHRDIKPENILFDKDDNALLADFGITLELSGGRTASFQGIGGSLPYMAPEQFRGEVSLRSDQYALGCIAYELIAGRRPIEVSIDDSASVEMKIVAWTQALATDYKIRPLRIKTGSLDLSVEHEAAILKAIAKARKDRHLSIDEFLKALNIRFGSITGKFGDIYENATLLKEQGDSYRKNKDYERALSAYNASIQMKADAKIYNRKGLVLRALKRYSESLQAYEEALEIAPSDKRDFLYSNMGDVLSDMGVYEDALRAYNKAIRLSPDQPVFYIYKGNVLRSMRDFKGALSIYEMAIQYATFTSNKKVSALAYGSKGEALTGLRRFTEAIEAYTKAIQFEPTNSSWYLAKGNTHWKCRQNEQACHTYREGLKFDPANAELLERLRITCK